MAMEWINLIISAAAGGSIVAIFTLPSAIRKAKAEARSADLDNLQKACDGWKALADERQEANREKDERIAELTKQVDERYIDIGNWRDKYNAQQEEITTLKVTIAANQLKLCEKKGCPDRTPPTGY